MLKIGITGGIGSGKTTVCKIFESIGVPVFYADQVGREITNMNSVRKKITLEFGQDLYHEGQLLRDKMASIVFSDSEKLKKLNAIIHPAVAEAYHRWLSQHKANAYTLKEAAILYESGSNKGLDRVIVVTAPKELRIKRVMERDGVKASEVLERMSKQWPEDKLTELSDYQITNDGIQELKPQVMALHQKIINL